MYPILIKKCCPICIMLLGFRCIMYLTIKFNAKTQ